MKDLLLTIREKSLKKEFTTFNHLLFLINSKLLCHHKVMPQYECNVYIEENPSYCYFRVYYKNK